MFAESAESVELYDAVLEIDTNGAWRWRNISSPSGIPAPFGKTLFYSSRYVTRRFASFSYRLSGEAAAPSRMVSPG